MANAPKRIKFKGTSLHELRDFPETARREAGYQLGRVQNGLEPDDFKPMPAVGSGAQEIRIKEESGIFRVLYAAKFEDAVYVLHCFQKKTQRTAKNDIDLARGRYGDHQGERAMSEETFDSVWDAIEDDPAIAENMKLRSMLMMALAEHIKSAGLSQTEAAKLFAVSQPRISDLIRGKIALFSIDSLVAMLGTAGIRVDVKLKMPRTRSAV